MVWPKILPNRRTMSLYNPKSFRSWILKVDKIMSGIWYTASSYYIERPKYPHFQKSKKHTFTNLHKKKLSGMLKDILIFNKKIMGSLTFSNIAGNLALKKDKKFVSNYSAYKCAKSKIWSLGGKSTLYLSFKPNIMKFE